MKKFLPRTATNQKGFTLVELLVVITIIAILSVIGVTIFSGVQKNARDTRRKADIDSIAKALEANKVPTSSTYVNLTGSAFGGGSVPTDSGNGSNTYCVYSSATAPITGPTTAWTGATCPSVGSNTANSVISTAVTLVGSANNWTVCASLETTTAPTTYCKSSVQ
jgi:type IV pilus assembly protein PilA